MLIKFFRSDRIGFHGWVVISVRNEFHADEISYDFSPILSNIDCEQIWRAILVGYERILIGCIYRNHPCSTYSNDSTLDENIFNNIKDAASFSIRKSLTRFLSLVTSTSRMLNGTLTKMLVILEQIRILVKDSLTYWLMKVSPNLWCSQL